MRQAGGRWAARHRGCCTVAAAPSKTGAPLHADVRVAGALNATVGLSSQAELSGHCRQLPAAVALW